MGARGHSTLRQAQGTNDKFRELAPNQLPPFDRLRERRTGSGNGNRAVSRWLSLSKPVRPLPGQQPADQASSLHRLSLGDAQIGDCAHSMGAQRRDADAQLGGLGNHRTRRP